MTNLRELLTDIWKFLIARKIWWLSPIILALLFIGALIVLSGTSALAPLIYTLF